MGREKSSIYRLQMPDSYGDWRFNVDIATLPTARAIPSSHVSEPRVEGSGQDHKGLQANKPTTQEAKLPVATFGIFGVLGGWDWWWQMQVLPHLWWRGAHPAVPFNIARAWLPPSRDHDHLLNLQSIHSPPLNQQGLGLADQETETLPAGQSNPWPLLLKKNLCFHCWRKWEPSLATNKLPTSRCAQSIHPHSPKRISLGRDQAAWSPPTLFTQINEYSLNRNAFSSTVVAVVFQSMTHPISVGLEEKPWFVKKRLLSFLCFSPWHHTAWTMYQFQIILKKGPVSVFAVVSQTCEVWWLLLMVWIILYGQPWELSKRSPAPKGIQ